VKTLAASRQHFTPAYNILHQPTTVKTLAASLRDFTQFIARFIPLLRSYTVLRWCVDSKRSEAHERKKRANSCRDPIRFSAVLYTLTLASGKRTDVFIFHFRTEYCRFYCVFFSTASKTYANDVHREVPESAHNTVFLKPLDGVL
jgi:hypothetical protein